MWLLSTARAELHFFSDPAAVPKGYATLSHTWSQDPNNPEQSFQDAQRIATECRANGTNPRDVVCEKIRMCCITAERDGYHWVWIDTCCINKESSTELSEAINSMFTWYVLCEVCYAFLDDVSSDDDPKATNSQFRHSRWHTRGWTLQELLAPALVYFLSKDWETIGSKHDLAETLEGITRIYSKYLTRDWDFLTASIAVKMRWASRRKTSRVEDEAYCLLGLFDINMPTLYGEGRQAFIRLQAEIVRLSYDTTLFAWGNVHLPSDETLAQAPSQGNVDNFHDFHEYLFAPSPAYFHIPYFYAAAVTLKEKVSHFLMSHEKALDVRNRVTSFGAVTPPSFTLTPHGMKCHFPIAEADGPTIMVLLAFKYPYKHVGLLLCPAQPSEFQDPNLPVYYVSWRFKTTDSHRVLRLADLGDDLDSLTFRGQSLKPVWRDICIRAAPRTQDRTDTPHMIIRMRHDQTIALFRVPRCLIGELSALQLLVFSSVFETDDNAAHERVLLCQEASIPVRIRIKTGICKRASTDEAPMHWAWAMTASRKTWYDSWDRPHDCATDHVDDWKGEQRSFGDEERTVRISFTTDRHNKKTRVLHVELHGTVYEELQREANVWIGREDPSRSLAAAAALESARPGTGEALDVQLTPEGLPVSHTPLPTPTTSSSLSTNAALPRGVVATTNADSTPAARLRDAIASPIIDPRTLDLGSLSASDLDALKLRLSHLLPLLEALRLVAPDSVPP
ncbi:HET-domain-containing protein [Epithele typhae]|uniref:HET-domain-containing protein n=1 Tax=Epithele typhae TaxID=378194 RepID=UPI0020077EBB|nr:HET-domain-containing protein [Epithele typhae]KAH9935209.1 HET-domain-containing protein [Epithele typhae]